ncbi:outer membrane protein [Cystobacter fuscus]|uniref:outer membrane protein n=1 Tax=Cystobacter fuscus TaxID=43 RepID=UPI0037C01C6E
MNTKILAGLVTAVLTSGAAVAQEADMDVNQGHEQGAPANMGIGGAGDTNLQEQGLGGSGQVAAPSAIQPSAPNSQIIQGQGGVTLYCTPLQQGTGGAGAPVHDPHAGLLPGEQPSSLQRDYDVHDSEAIGGSGYDVKEAEALRALDEKPKKEADMRGLTVMVGGGVEGYTGGLAPEVRPGAAVGVTAAIKPSKVFGIELGYSGAANDLRDNAGSGPDIIRNGGQAALTFGLAATPVQPYVLGGLGLNRYNVRNSGDTGFRDDTNANIPVGAGLRTHIGDFTADARINYNFLLNNDFSPGVDADTWTGRYTGTINLGGTF